jgi:hypothetical protein
MPLFCPTRQRLFGITELKSGAPVSTVHGVVFEIFVGRSASAARPNIASASPSLWQLDKRRASRAEKIDLHQEIGASPVGRDAAQSHGRIIMNGNRYYGVRVEGAKYGVGFGSALAIAISYTNNHSILWAIIHGILGWLYVIFVALFR